MADETYLGWHLTWIEQWSQFLGGCNWYTFQPVLIEFEDDRCMGGIEVTLVLLGLGVRVRWNYAVTEQLEDIFRQVEAIKRDERSEPHA